MIQTDYPVEALAILLDRECLSERYHALIPYQQGLISGLRGLGCRTKSDAEKLPDAELMQMGPFSPEQLRLLRRFFILYDVKPQKLREIERITADPEERAAFRELYYLPGVKQIRASLYYRAGYRSLGDFAETTVEEVLARTVRAISNENLSCIVPLPKEVRTHIAVARAFTGLPADPTE